MVTSRAVVGIMRGGKLAHLEAVGYRDAATKEPLGTDGIFSIASMTKPMTSAAIMRLVEEGRVLLGDPVSKYLPPLAALKVAQDGGRVESRTPKQAPTIQDLLRHTSGLTYSERGNTPAHKAYPGSSIVTAERMDKDDTIAALAKAPLLFDPGSDWEYGFSTDVLGFVVEAVTGMPLGDILAQRLWSPLGMAIQFALPAAKRSRYALALAKDPFTGEPIPPSITPPRRLSAGSRAAAARSRRCRLPALCEMLRSGGSLGSADILGRGTVTLMTSDHLPVSFVSKIADTMDPAASGYGFGLGFAVRRQDGIAAMAGSAGDYYWSGMYGTYFWIDPRERAVGGVPRRGARPDPPALPSNSAQHGVSGADIIVGFPSRAGLASEPAIDETPASRRARMIMAEAPPFKTTMQFAYGEPRELAPGVVRIVANNPSPFTFKGTNTYMVGTGMSWPDRSRPGRSAHLEAILKTVGGRRLTHILITHTHRDHTDGLPALLAATGAKTAGFGHRARTAAPSAPARRAASSWIRISCRMSPLADGQTLEGDGWASGPAHARARAGSPVFRAGGHRVLFSGDHVMGWNTSVVAPPEGNMGDYIRSLRELTDRSDEVYFPGHGGQFEDPQRLVKAFLLHRRMREQAILECIRDGNARCAASCRSSIAASIRSSSTQRLFLSSPTLST